MSSFSVEVSVQESGRKRPEYSIDTDLAGEITLIDLLQWTKQTLIVTSDEVLKDEQRQGFDKKPILTVDGRAGKPVLAVSPLGQIEFTARSDVKEILFDTYEALLFRSKVLTGRYKSSHFVFHNGIQVASSLRELEVWYAFAAPEFKDEDIIRFVNVQPYARKLERFGITAQRSKTKYTAPGKRRGQLRDRLIMAPNGTYQLTARAIKSKYKRNSSIKFAFISGASLGISGSFKSSGRGGRKSAGRPYLYPSITIKISERGTT